MASFRLALSGCFLVATTLGCSSNDHPPFILPSGTDRGIAGPASGGGSGDALEPNSEADGGEPGDTQGSPVVSPGSLTFDSAQVYWVGTAQGMEAFSTVAAPRRFTLGIYAGTSYAYAANSIWYHHREQPVFKFVPDSSGPPAPAGFRPQSYLDNDEMVPTKACPSVRGNESGTAPAGPYTFLVSPSGRVVYQCLFSGPWYEDDHIVVSQREMRALGYGDVALVAYYNGSCYLLNLSDGSEIPVKVCGSTLRAADDGFDIVVSEKADGSASLVHLDATGEAHELGMYPARSKDYFYWSQALGADHAIYEFAGNFEQDFFIFRRRLDGSAGEIVFTQKYDPDAGQFDHYDTPIQIFPEESNKPGSVLFSGP